MVNKPPTLTAQRWVRFTSIFMIFDAVTHWDLAFALTFIMKSFGGDSVLKLTVKCSKGLFVMHWFIITLFCLKDHNNQSTSVCTDFSVYNETTRSLKEKK